jgi:hypothetical protein
VRKRNALIHEDGLVIHISYYSVLIIK